MLGRAGIAHALNREDPIIRFDEKPILATRPLAYNPSLCSRAVESLRHHRLPRHIAGTRPVMKASREQSYGYYADER